MRRLIITLVFMSIMISCYPQQRLQRTRTEIKYILSITPHTEVMQEDAEHIHAVNDDDLTNLIFYFDKNDICKIFFTTHQVIEKYDSVEIKLNRDFSKAGENSWISFMKDGFDFITLVRKNGYFFTREEFFEYP